MRYVFRERGEVSEDGTEELLSVSKYTGVKVRSTTTNREARAASLVGYKKCEPNDIVSNIMLAWDSALGVAFDSGIVSSAYEVYVPQQEIDPHFLDLLLRTPEYRVAFTIVSKGIVPSRWRMYTESFNDILMILPSLNEQKQIGTYVHRIDENISLNIKNLEIQLSLLEEKRSAFITKTVTKSLNLNVLMRDSGIEWIGKVPEHWEIVPLKFDFDIQLGKMLQNDRKKDTDTHEYYLKSANIQWNGVSLKPKSKMWFSKAEKEKYHLIKGDLLISEGGDVGRSCLYDNEYEDCYIQNAVHRVRSTSYISTDYLYYFMRSMHHSGFIEIICNKSTIPHFTVEKVSRVRFTRPPSDEISEIVKQLNVKCKQIQDSMNLIEDTIKKLKEYRTALISAAVTGKIDLRGQA